MRASDADREAVADALRDAHAEGRLTLEEFEERLDATLAAKTIGELAVVTKDLPSPQRSDRGHHRRADAGRSPHGAAATWGRLGEPASSSVGLGGVSVRTGQRDFWPIWVAGRGARCCSPTLGGPHAAEREEPRRRR